MAGQKIRIRLKAYDHEAIDASARKIVETVTRTGARVVGPVPLPTEKNVYCVIRSPHKYKDSREHLDRKSTRLNSSHANISYAVFCLKHKNRRDAHEPRLVAVDPRERE